MFCKEDEHCLALINAPLSLRICQDRGNEPTDLSQSLSLALFAA